MALTIPPHYERKIDQLAQTQHITSDEALDRILDAGLEQLAHAPAKPRRPYTEFFGIAKGRPGAHGSAEAIDRYIAELRSEW